MAENAITIAPLEYSGHENVQTLIPVGAIKDEKHRLTRFAAWLDSTGQRWYAPDLAAYRDHLQTTLKASSVQTHLSTIRGRYKALAKANDIRDRLYAQTPAGLSPADKKAYVDELLTRLENATSGNAAPVKVIKSQDRADNAHVRLTSAQANSLLDAPGVETLTGLRDTALIALMLCTGLREMELCNLDVADLRQRLGGELALHVRRGKGAKERLIPYGELSWCLAYVDTWLKHAGITDGAVFRGFYKHAKSLRKARLSVRAVQDILNAYPVSIDGQLTRLNPHDLRRTYARRLYEAGLDLISIQQNLGHADTKTTLTYIGTLGADKRRPPAIYQPRNLAALV